MRYLKNLEKKWNRFLSKPLDMDSYPGFLVTSLLMGLLVFTIIVVTNPGWKF